MSQREDINKLFVDTVALVGTSNISYYHLKSVENFIINLEKLGDVRSRNEIESMIIRYLEIIKELNGSDKMKMTERVDFFNEYLYPIAKIYETRLNFSVRIKPWIFCGWLLMGNGLIFAVGNFIPLYVIFNLLVCAFYIDSLIRQSNGMVFGFDY